MSTLEIRRRRRRRPRRDEGSALIITTLVLFMLMLLVMTLAGTNVARSEAAVHSRFRVQLLAAADAGIGFKMQEVLAADADPSSFPLRTYTVEGITVETYAEDAGGGAILLQSRATDGRGMRRVVEAYLATETHPLFRKSVYVGNKDMVTGYKFRAGPLDKAIKDAPNGSTTSVEDSDKARRISQGFETDYDSTKEKMDGVTLDGDYIEGDVYVNGDAEIRGTTNVYGNVDATGTVDGRPVSWTDPEAPYEAKAGVTTENSPSVTPPDLNAMNYWALSGGPGGFRVEADQDDEDGRHSTDVDFIHRGTFSQDDNTYFNKYPGQFERPNFQFGRPVMNDGVTAYYEIPAGQITGDGSQIIYVKGNLWLETNKGAGFKLPSSTNGKKVTIVVEGNLYISDELSYNNYNKDAFLFIVKGAAEQGNGESESFVDGYDENGNFDPDLMNGVYDDGEKLINDTHNPGHYDGPKEGQGNIYFGDRSQDWGGITDGFMYAENNGYLVTNNTKRQVFGVRGFFSAGGILDMGTGGAAVNRTVSKDGKRVFTNYRVKFDPRIADGTINLKGMPAASGGGFAGMSVVAWREVAPGQWSP